MERQRRGAVDADELGLGGDIVESPRPEGGQVIDQYTESGEQQRNRAGCDDQQIYLLPNRPVLERPSQSRDLWPYTAAASESIRELILSPARSRASALTTNLTVSS